MILSGPMIHEQVRQGNISIEPFDPIRLNPNSYNLRLGDKLLEYDSFAGFDTKNIEPPRGRYIPTPHRIPIEGMWLSPSCGYLGTTMERVRCDGFVPTIDGRSSIGRMFTLIHCTAGYGDDGFDGEWTLEIVPLIAPIRVYPGDEILQIRFTPVWGIRMPYKGKYQGQTGPTPSRMGENKDAQG